MGILAEHGLRGVVARAWRGKAGLKSVIPMNPDDPRLAAIMSDYFGMAEEKKLNSAYRQLPVVYACIQAKVRNLARVPFVLSLQGKEEPIEEGPLVDLFTNPNPAMSGHELWQAIIAGLDMYGEFFLWPERKTDAKGVPLAMSVLSPKRISVWKTRQGAWLGWEYKQGERDKVQIKADEMIHGRYWNPDDDLRGLAPLSALHMPNMLNWNAMRFARMFFENDATPAVVIESDKGLTVKQSKELEQQLYEKRKGVDKSHSFLILGGMKAKTLTPSNKEIQLLEMLSTSVDQVCMALGVPKTELSLYGDVNKATAFTQDRSFITKTLMPLGEMICYELNRDFLARFGVECRFDWSKVDAIRYDLLEKVDAAVKLVSIGFTANEVNERLDLGFEDAEWRDHQEEEPPPEEGPDEEQLPDEEPDDVPDKDEQKKSLDPSEAILAKKWGTLDQEILPLMAKASAKVRAYFADCERRLRSRFTLMAVRDAVTKAPIPPADDMPWVDEAFSDARLEGALKPTISQAGKKGVASVAAELHRAFNVPDSAASAAVLRRVNKIKELNKTAVRLIKQMLRAALAHTMDEGMSEDDAARYILDQMHTGMSMNMARAKTISRTETHGAYSDGRDKAMQIAQVENKRWISSRDDKVRCSHQEYEAAGVVPFDAEYAPGLKRPHDPDCNNPADVINCRCKLVAAFDLKE